MKMWLVILLLSTFGSVSPAAAAAAAGAGKDPIVKALPFIGFHPYARISWGENVRALFPQIIGFRKKSEDRALFAGLIDDPVESMSDYSDLNNIVAVTLHCGGTKEGHAYRPGEVVGIEIRKVSIGKEPNQWKGMELYADEKKIFNFYRVDRSFDILACLNTAFMDASKQIFSSASGKPENLTMDEIYKINPRNTEYPALEVACYKCGKDHKSCICCCFCVCGACLTAAAWRAQGAVLKYLFPGS